MDTAIRRTAARLAIVVVLVSPMAACAAKGPLAKAQVGALTATEIVKAIDAAETAAFEAKFYDDAKHKAVGLQIANLADATLAYVQAVRAWTNTGAQGAAASARAGVLSAIAAVMPMLPPAAQAAARSLQTLMTGVAE